MTIKAPVSGRLGTVAAKAGATVRAGETLAVINQIDPIYIAFALPQQRLPEIRRAMAAGGTTVTLKGAANGPAGKIAFMENSVDAATGTVLVKAEMPNPTEQLWPGAFADVVLTTGVDKGALAAPSAAILLGQGGAYVYVFKDGKAVVRPVTVARAVGEESIFASGLSAGDEIIVQGQGGLTDGADVRRKGDKDLQTSDAKPASSG
jgi:multidrug efflux system membrane fusion protein